MAHVAQYKKDVVKEIKKLLEEYPIIGTVNMENLPASALQVMRSKLRGKAMLKMTKRRFINIALDEVEKTKKGISALKEKLIGMPALLFTKENPFTIYKIIKQSKSPAAAKAGQIAPKEIIVKAGVTPFMPGPIIGQLSVLKIKSGVEGGKVAIKEDSVVAKEGDVISADLASILARLNITPMELGLDVTGVYEDGMIYDRKVLDIDEDKFMADLSQAATWANNLAIEAAYPTKDTISILIVKAHSESKSLGKEANILVPGMIEDLLAKAQGQAAGLQDAAK